MNEGSLFFTKGLSRRTFLVGSLGVVGAGLLAACGGDDDEAPSTNNDATSTSSSGGQDATQQTTPRAVHEGTAPAVATVTPAASVEASGGTLAGSTVVVALPSEPNSLDPQFELSGAVGTALNPMFHHLLDYNRDFQLQPEAAESFELLEDGLVFRFKLREGITFWNGEPLDANAVKFTYERTMDEALRQQGLTDPIPARQGIAELRVVDDLTIDIVLDEYRASALALFPLSFMLAPGYYTDNPPEVTAREPMGSGPWMFEEWVKDDHITMKANPNYFLGAPQIETLIYRTVPDRNTRLAMLETGEVDLADGLAPEDVTFIESNDDLRLVTTQSTGKVHVQIPCNVPRYADKRVRQALAMAVDTESIRANILGGLAGPRLTVPTTGDYWVNPDIAPVQYDPEAAKQLLEEAGFPMEEEIILYASQGQFTKNEDIAAAIASNFREIGLNCQHQVLERSVASEKTRAKDFGDLYLGVLFGRSYGPDDLNLINAASVNDTSRWLESSPMADQFNEQNELAQTSPDPEVQQEHVFEAMRIFMEESPWILLHLDIKIYGINKRIDWEPTGYSRIHPWLVGEQDVRIVEE